MNAAELQIEGDSYVSVSFIFLILLELFKELWDWKICSIKTTAY